MTTIRFLKRPGLSSFIKEMSEIFEIVIFTASGREYADAVIDSLEDISHLISHRLYWDHITIRKKKKLLSSMNSETLSEGGPEGPNEIEYFKDISKLGRDVSKIIVVDAYNYNQHPQNGIGIKPWKGDTNDTALSELQTMLEKLRPVSTNISYKHKLRRQLDHQSDLTSSSEFYPEL